MKKYTWKCIEIINQSWLSRKYIVFSIATNNIDNQRCIEIKDKLKTLIESTKEKHKGVHVTL